MTLLEILRMKGMSQYRLSKISKVPLTTISDLCSGKTKLESCKAGTLYRICKALKVSMDDMMREAMDPSKEYRASFEVFKSNICHYLKNYGDVLFVQNTIDNNEIQDLYDKKQYPEAFYLLAMIDYLSRINDIPLDADFDNMRCQKLDTVIYPSGILLESRLFHDESIKEKAFNDSIPEFRNFNIVENDIRNVA